MQTMGVPEDGDDYDEEVRIVLEAPDGDYYLMKGDFSPDAVTQFVRNFYASKLKPFLKSERPPIKQTGPVVTVVGDTFEEIVHNPNEDVLIEFYAPWCGHCKVRMRTERAWTRHG